MIRRQRIIVLLQVVVAIFSLQFRFSIGFAGGGGFGGGNKKKQPIGNKKKKGKGATVSGAGFSKSRNQQEEYSVGADSKSQHPSSSRELLETIELGKNPGTKTVQLYVPPNRLEGSQDIISKFAPQKKKNKKNKARRDDLLAKYENYRGTGDVIWPSSLQLARLIANCPSFVNDKRVLDLGCGLGLASVATLLCQPQSLVMSDVDANVLELAWKSCQHHCRQQESKTKVDATVKMDRVELDWTQTATWPNQGLFDVILASDILYDDTATDHVSELIAHLFGDDDDDLLSLGTSASSPTTGGEEEMKIAQKRALIVDPKNRPHRDIFVKSCAKHGLTAEIMPFPGQEAHFVLINVTPRSLF